MLGIPARPAARPSRKSANRRRFWPRTGVPVHSPGSAPRRRRQPEIRRGLRLREQAMKTKNLVLFLMVAGLAFALGCQVQAGRVASGDGDADAGGMPVPDPSWPILPDDWLIGEVAGIAVDMDDNIWLVHRPRSLNADEAGLMQDPPLTACCNPAPPVLKFDTDGNLLDSWGDHTGYPGEGYEWPASEHGIFVDHMGNVWLAGKRAGRPPGPQVQRRRHLPDADRSGRPDRGQQQHRVPGPAGGHGSGPGDERALHRRRLPEQAGHRVRRRQRRVPAALGAPTETSPPTTTPGRSSPGRTRSSSSGLRSTRCGSPPTGWSMWPTG